MPRPKKKLDIIATLRTEAARVVEALDAEIDRRRAELAELMSHADSWRAALGGRIAKVFGAKAVAKPTRTRRSVGRPRGGKRVNWDGVLAALPENFTIEDVLKNPDAARKGRAQIYPALNRWEAAKAIKRTAKGRYRRVASGEAAPASASKPAGAARKGAAPGRTRGAAAARKA